MVLWIVLWSFAAFIVLIHFLLDVGVLLAMASSRRRSRVPEGPVPSAAVVVAVRDEEEDLPALLESLRRQTLRSCSFVFVDDRSRDATPAILERFREDLGDRVTVIRNDEEPVGMTGKQAALEKGVAAVAADVLLLTDGDCVVPQTWAAKLCSCFEDPRVGVVFGRIGLPEGTDFLSRFQAYEQPHIHQYNIGGAGASVPLGCYGNNLAVRRKAILDIGGFRGLGYTLTEDAALLSAVTRRAGWRALVELSADCAIRTQPQPCWSAFVRQHVRWNAGGFFSSDLATRVAYRFITLYLVASVLAVPLALLDLRFATLWLVSMLTIGFLGFLGGLYDGVDRLRFYRRLIPYTAFFTFFYSWMTVLTILRRTVDWKGTSMNSVGRGPDRRPPRPSAHSPGSRARRPKVWTW
jgi:cellulose synthase/poly-beta-1,6-N-acetylglucosamine synthase-like glycosyltransferase